MRMRREINIKLKRKIVNTENTTGGGEVNKQNESIYERKINITGKKVVRKKTYR